MQHPDDGLIEEYLDGELASPERAELEAHLDGCAACRERVEASRRFLAEASQLIEDLGEPVPAIPLGGEFPSPAPARPARPARPPYRQLAWAATLVIAAGVGYASGTWNARLVSAPEARQKAPAATAESALALQPGRLPASPPAEPSGHPAIQPSEERERRAAAELQERPLGQVEAGQRADALRDGDQARRREAKPSSQPPIQPSEFAKSAAAAPNANAAPQAVQPPGRPAATLDDAVRVLGGSIRLIDGMEVEQVEIEEPAVVVLTYRDAAGNPIELRQSRPLDLARRALAAESQRLEAAAADRAERSRAAAQAPAPAPAAGALDAAAGKDKEEDGGLGWTDSAGFRLLLRADADADSLRKIRTRIR